VDIFSAFLSTCSSHKICTPTPYQISRLLSFKRYGKLPPERFLFVPTGVYIKLKTEFAPRPDKLNPEFTKAMAKMFRGYRGMSFEQKVRYIEEKEITTYRWIEPTVLQESLF